MRTRLTGVFLTALLRFLLWALPRLSNGSCLTVVSLTFSMLAQGGGGVHTCVPGDNQPRPVIGGASVHTQSFLLYWQSFLEVKWLAFPTDQTAMVNSLHDNPFPVGDMDWPLSGWGYGPAPVQLGTWTSPFAVGDMDWPPSGRGYGLVPVQLGIWTGPFPVGDMDWPLSSRGYGPGPALTFIHFVGR